MEDTASICGAWVDDEGRAHVCVDPGDGSRSEQIRPFRPFAWLTARPAEAVLPGGAVQIEPLRGPGAFRWLAHAPAAEPFEAFVSAVRKSQPDPGPVEVDVIRPYETQFLIQDRCRLFARVPFGRLRRCQLDIETGSEDGSFSNPDRAGDRVLAVGLRTAGTNALLILEEPTDAGERRLLLAFNAALAAADPDVVEGHNLFRFDLDYLRRRARRLKVPCAWGRFGQPAAFRPSRLKVAERQIDFPRCDLPGRAVVDTCFLAQFYDLTARELPSYGLKDVALHLGITRPGESGRTRIAGGDIARTFSEDRERFLAYLGDDLRETAGVADLLLPTYFEQARAFPLSLQEATLRGTAVKVDLLFLEEYYHGREACPRPPEVAAFGGAYTRSFREGVFHRVLHFDVASLYPSLLLNIGRNPGGDTLGVFIPLLARLREYRLRFKQRARSAPTAEERAEAGARQASFKILINSFYGYLGFPGARFADGDLAAEVTRRGRELLQSLVTAFGELGCTVLEADTDGIYLESQRHFGEPEALLAAVAPVLPAGIELEADGSYGAMFCYKAKNYALLDGDRVVIRGSALRSRGTEPFLRRLTDALIGRLLGVGREDPAVLLEGMHRDIAARTYPVADLARAESLGQSPEQYERFVASGGKPRRAAAEAALLLSPRPARGEKVAYFIAELPGGARLADWQRARPLALHDPEGLPYDAGYYLEKLDDWLERYGPFVPGGLRRAPSGRPVQDELF